MERLTERYDGTVMVKGCGSNCKYGFIHCRKEDWENCKTIDDVIDKLAEYEDAEEQGLLLRLPCKVGDIIYQIWYVDDKPEIAEMKIATLNNLVALMEYGDFGKTVFLTKAEAEQKLKGMESD